MNAHQSIIGLFFNASLLVKLIMLLLLSISLLSWTLIFYRGSFLKFRKRELEKFLQRFKSADLTGLYQQLKEHSLGGVSAIFYSGFKEFITMKKIGANANTILEAVNRSMGIAESKEFDKLEKNIAILATIGSTSPYIGLFGTVWGIMSSFQSLGQVQQATIAMVAPGISEALIATAMGLFVAIPAVIAYNRYATRVDTLANQYATFKEEMIALLARKLHQQEVAHEVDYD